MSTLAKQIEKKIIKVNSDQYKSSILGCVQSYDSFSNRAVVAYMDNITGEVAIVRDVSVQLSSSGSHSAGPFKGDYVWMEFVNQNPNLPKVVALADEIYYNNIRVRMDNTEQGQLLDNDIATYQGFQRKSTIDEMLAGLFDSGGIAGALGGIFGTILGSIGQFFTTIFSGIAGLFNGLTQAVAQSGQASKDVSDNEHVINMTNYAADEVGVTSPVNQSSMKIRANSIIDIFGNGNIGIRIDPRENRKAIVHWTEKNKTFANYDEIWADEILKHVAIRGV
jgi:hypothetical protein